jgi:hypothetical protein
MPYARPISIPVNKTTLSRPVVMSKRVAAPRKIYKNIRKLQAIPGQIVYITQRGKVHPMRVLCIDDCYIWSTGAKWENRKGYMIYYDLQPLVKINGVWRAKRLLANHRRSHWRIWNNRIWQDGWIGHAVDMGEFFHTCAEANWILMY